ncbi:hypothetical protein P278_33560 [Zhouia amylolytica AD3]|uniref:Uncharacterized protein n=2 Tax=Zhouia amylolytica TaxID=376730 RepID=W2UIF0_9FLAO|nr:hypothetical protein P278_33560 [Zhouia amylolytica AD3]
MIASCLLTSCNFTEEMYLNQDGSGKIAINFDGSELMEMAGDELAKENKKAVDSTFYFKDILEEKKDSISKLPKEEQEKLKKLERFAMHMLMNPETKEMKFEMFTNFNSVKELGDVFDAFHEANKLQGASEGKQMKTDPAFGANSDASKVAYKFNGRKFSRITTIVDEALLQQTIDSLGEANMFLSGSSYTLKYHFPKKIKSVSSDKAMLSADGKTLILEAGFMEYMKDPKILDLEVTLEK